MGGKKKKREPRGGPDDNAAVAATEIDLLVDGKPLERQEINGKTYVEVPGPGTEFAIRVRMPQEHGTLATRLTVDGCMPPHWYRGRPEKIVDSFPVDRNWGRKLVFGSPDAGNGANGPSDSRSASEAAGLGSVRVRIFKVQQVPRRWQSADEYDYAVTGKLVKPRVAQCGDAEGLMLKTTAELGSPAPNPHELCGQWVDTQCPTTNPAKDVVFHYRTKAQIAGIPTDDVKPEPKVKQEGQRKRRRAGDNKDCAIQLD